MYVCMCDIGCYGMGVYHIIMCVKLSGILHTQLLTLCVDNSPSNGQLYTLWLLHWLTSYALVNEDNNEMAGFV